MNQIFTPFSYIYWTACRANKAFGSSDEGRAIGAPVFVALLWAFVGIVGWIPKREAWVIFVIGGVVGIGGLFLVAALQERFRIQFGAFEKLDPKLRRLCDAGALLAVVLPLILIPLLGSAR